MSSGLEHSLLNYLPKTLLSDTFQDAARFKANSFVRNRCMPLAALVIFLLNMVKDSLQTELNAFFGLLYNFKHSKTFMTKSALSRARAKLRPEAFTLLNEVIQPSGLPVNFGSEV